MKRSWRLIDCILNEQKTIESRWFIRQTSPWNQVHPGDTIYFKETGCPVTAKAQVSQVKQFSHLTPEQKTTILRQYSDKLCPPSLLPQIKQYIQPKKHCLLIFLANPQPIKPFHIDKTGFSPMSAWLTVDHLSQLRPQPILK